MRWQPLNKKTDATAPLYRSQKVAGFTMLFLNLAHLDRGNRVKNIVFEIHGAWNLGKSLDMSEVWFSPLVP